MLEEIFFLIFSIENFFLIKNFFFKIDRFIHQNVQNEILRNFYNQ